MDLRYRTVLRCLLGFCAASSALAAPFTPGNLVVSRIGGPEDDLINLPDSAARVRLVEISPVDGSIVQEVRLPALASEVAGSNNRRLTLNRDFRAGLLHRSENGLYLVIGGYDADAANGATPGTLQVNRTASVTVNRVVARVDASGAVDTTTAITNVVAQAGLYEGTQGSFRSVATSDGTHFWLSGNHNGSGSSRQGRAQHVAYQGTESNHLPTSSNSGNEFVNARVVNIFFGQLYGSWNIESTSRNQHRGVYTIGTGLPTESGQVTVNLPNVFDQDFVSRVGSPYDFFFSDPDTVYLCNDDPTGPDNGGILKFARDTVPESPTFGKLTYRYTLSAGLTPAQQTVRTLTGKIDGSGHVVLYTISAVSVDNSELRNRLLTVTDTGCPTGVEPGCSAADTFTTLTTAGDLEAFRGVAWAPRACEGAECIGACCLPGQSCAEMTDTACAAANGLFRGYQTTCATMVCPLVCNNPFADVDSDTDVDLDDFAAFQQCYTGDTTPVTSECKCFDRPEVEFPGGNGFIDQADFNAFVNCGTRAQVPADPACDD